MDVILLSVATASCIVYMVTSMLEVVPESLSATYYRLGRRGWVFQAFMVLMAVLMYLVWFPVCKDEYRCMVFLACASLLFVAAAPCFKLKLEGMVHYSSAIVCCVCVVLWQILEGLWDVTLWFAWIGGMLSLVMKDKWCWWVECAVVGSLLANLWRIV